MRNEVKNATQRLLRESVVPLLPSYSCGRSIGWRRVVNLNMSDPSQQCPSVWQEITTPHRVCGRRYNSSSGDCQGLTYTIGNRQYDQVCRRIIGYQSGPSSAFYPSPGRSINTDTWKELVSHVAPPADISGPLLLVLMNREVTLMNNASVSLAVQVAAVFLHLWARTTSVIQA